MDGVSRERYTQDDGHSFLAFEDSNFLVSVMFGFTAYLTYITVYKVMVFTEVSLYI